MGYQHDYCDKEYDQFDSDERQSSAIITVDQKDYIDDEHGQLDVEDRQRLRGPGKIIRSVALGNDFSPGPPKTSYSPAWSGFFLPQKTAAGRSANYPMSYFS